jgi:adenosylcobyric acid synthase
MKSIMIQGTSSDSGKSYITTAICRVLSNRGFKVAPFKSQNMSNNSYAADDGYEISRAQGVQAEAAKAVPTVFMNPILLKPTRDTESEVVLFGKVFNKYSGFNYRENFALNYGVKAIEDSLKELSKNYEALVIEGAGSPAEVNLNDKEIVNMRVAELADAGVILVTDIDRGGSFASVVGTLELLKEHRSRFKGVVFNKFRGDVNLLKDGLDWLEKNYDIKVLGVMPYFNDIYIETEDAQSKQLLFQYEGSNPIDIAVIHLERVSNNTDVEPFIHESDVSVRIVKNPQEFGNPHAVIIPGTKSTIEDLMSLIKSGMYEKLVEYNKRGGIIAGICGGYQILGIKIMDPMMVDNTNLKEIKGLSILPVLTEFKGDKKVRQIKGRTNNAFSQTEVQGYEIHLGNTRFKENTESKAEYFSMLEDNVYDGCVIDEGRVFGTYLHNIFHNDNFRNKWLNKVRESRGMECKAVVDTAKIKEDSYEKLAAYAEKYLDIDHIVKILNKEV